jgi:hypothetical protein
MSAIDLEYEPGSLLPPVTARQIRKFEKYLSEIWERHVRLPAAYVEHVKAFHGGVPGKKCFKTEGGQVRVVGRFANFLEEDDLESPSMPSWRPGGQDIRLDYSLYDYSDNEMWDERLRGGGEAALLPIAGLDTAGHDCRLMTEYDLLCLDYDTEGEEPSVVIFDFHESIDVPVLEFVADSFEEFLLMLYRCKNRVTREKIDTF